MKKIEEIDIKVLVAMIKHIETYLPENWQKEKWFVDAKKVIEGLAIEKT